MLNTQIINKYICELKPRLDKILRTNSNEENIRPVFIELLNRCGSHKDLWVVTEDRVKNNKKPDGAIKNIIVAPLTVPELLALDFEKV